MKNLARKRKVTEAELFEKDWDGKRQTKLNKDMLLAPPKVLSPTFITVGEFDQLTSEQSRGAQEGTSAGPTDSAQEPGSAVPLVISRKSKKFRLQGKRFFLTFPQCEDVDKRIIYERINSISTTKFVVIGKEQHMDGGIHFHIALEFDKKYDTKNSSCFDFLVGKHGDYKPMKNLRKCLQYCTKDDKDFFSSGIDVKEFLSHQTKGIEYSIAKMIKDGKHLREVDNDHPAYVMRNYKKVVDYQAFQKRLKIIQQPALKWYGCEPGDEANTNLQISTWLNKNLNSKREFKQAQLYIHGPKNLGKTTLVENLRKYFRVYDIPVEDFYDFYDDDDWDLAVLDEFKGQKTIQWLNLFLQGNTMTLRKKGAQILKLKNIPVIILSNFSIDNAYGKVMADRLESLQCRLEIVEIVDPINISFNSNIRAEPEDLLDISDNETLIGAEDIPEENARGKEKIEEQEEEPIIFDDYDEIIPKPVSSDQNIIEEARQILTQSANIDDTTADRIIKGVTERYQPTD